MSMSIRNVSREKLERYVEQLRDVDTTQFYTICRMHLSFLIDLEKDKFDEILTDSTCKLDAKSKRTAFSLRKKGSGSKDSSFSSGTSLSESSVIQLSKLIDYLMLPQNLEQEGLFRKTGNISRQRQLKERLNSGENTDFEDGDYSAHDCASTLKNYLGELPEPLLMDRLYSLHCLVADMSCDDKKVKVLQLLFLLTPLSNHRLLKKILLLLHQVADTHANKMSADALGTMFAPQILCPRKMTGSELHTEASKLTQATSFMISNAPQLFQVPTLLGFDVVQYLKENHADLNISRISSSSSEDNLDSSNRKRQRSVGEDEGDGAHTIVSFVDRENSANCSSQCDTEVALAQLYAHVQSMPESGKKRKLLKQFNRNGVGTQPEGRRHKRSRSLGEQLKKRFLKNHKRQQSSHSSTQDENSSPEVFISDIKASPVRVIDLSKTSSPCEKKIMKLSTDSDSSTTIHMPPIKRSLLITPSSTKIRKNKDPRFISPISYSFKGASKDLQTQLSTPRSRVPIDLLQTDL